MCHREVLIASSIFTAAIIQSNIISKESVHVTFDSCFAHTCQEAREVVYVQNKEGQDADGILGSCKKK